MTAAKDGSKPPPRAHPTFAARAPHQPPPRPRTQSSPLLCGAVTKSPWVHGQRHHRRSPEPLRRSSSGGRFEDYFIFCDRTVSIGECPFSCSACTIANSIGYS